MATFKRVGCSKAEKNSSQRSIERYFVKKSPEDAKTARTPSKTKKRLLVDRSNDAEKPKRKKLQLSRSIRKGAPLEKTPISIEFDDSLNDSALAALSIDDSEKKIPPETSGYLRCHVIDVKRTNSRELTLKLERKRHDVIECILRDDWFYTEIRPKDVINIISDSYASPIVLDASSESFLVLEPDSLLSVTSVAMATRCPRRAALDAVFKNGNVANRSTVLGSLVHDAFEASLESGEFGAREVEISLEEKLKKLKWMESLYALNMSEVDALDSAKEFVSNFGKFADDFFGGRGSPVHIKNSVGGDDPRVSVDRVCDIEETLWSPRFGLKGKIDATVGIRMNDDEEYVIPFEIKSGKMLSEIGSIDHRAQVSLYSLMLSEWVGQVPAGLLFYAKTGHVTGVAGSLAEQRALVMKRNELARRVSVSEMPEVIRNKHSCLRCPQLSNCMLYHRGIEGGSASTSGIDEDFVRVTGHVTDSEIEYFRRWCRLIRIETKACVLKSKREKLWTQSAWKREETGTCFADVKVIRVDTNPDDDVILHTFESKRQRLRDLNIGQGDHVIVSRQDEKPRVGVASGFVVSLAESRCIIRLDKVLSVGGPYCIDKEESGFSFHAYWSNLARVFDPELARLRQSIIALKSPTFRRDVTAEVSGLNENQEKAVKKALAAENYALIRGMPGTGKTTTIAALARLLAARRKRVLIASYTNSAVDNILLKLQKAGLDFLRLGNVHSMHPSIRRHSVVEAAKFVSTVKDLDEFYQSKYIFATTCLSLSHPVFRRLSFDYCIIDEASQIVEPVCIGPLIIAKTFVLVGDHFQLPPLVQSKEARDGGMDVSLFKRLCESHPHAVANLEIQYRMNSDVMFLANSIVYNSRLKCASDSVERDRMFLPKPVFSNRQWLKNAVDSQNSVIFLDIDQIIDEDKQTRTLTSDIEASIIKLIVEEFAKAKADLSEIGIISPYRRQLQTLRNTLESVNAKGVEIDTVDKFQGRDKSCIIISFVRSNPSRGIGDLLRDWRRINVAITRAKHKLILVGSRATLKSKSSSILERMISVLESRKWVYVLPKNWNEF